MLPPKAIEAPILPTIGNHVNLIRLSPKPAKGPINPVFNGLIPSFSSGDVVSSIAADNPKITASKLT